jgi:hypothetical protein
LGGDSKLRIEAGTPRQETRLAVIQLQQENKARRQQAQQRNVRVTEKTTMDE